MQNGKFFSINVQRLMNERNWKQQDLADKLGLSWRNYAAYEYAYKTGGKPWPRPERIDEFARALKCDPTDFFSK